MTQNNPVEGGKSRQVLYQERRVAEGRCRSCGRKRGKGYEDKIRCKVCLRADAEKKRLLTEEKAQGV